MIRYKFIYPTILFGSIFFSCTNEEATIFTVSGQVYYLGEPIEDVAVSIDDQYNWTVQTDADGFFNISSVSSGEHQLNMKKNLIGLQNTANDTSGFTEKTINISVHEDLELSYLKLPKAVLLHEPTDVTESRAFISWSPTDDEEFREYKLFRHHSSGLDETTGTLVHVSTFLSDTSFSDEQLDPFQNYYYRVYVMNEYGRIGGSNIVSLQTLNSQLISNGGFEELSGGVPMDWQLIPNSGDPENYIQIDPNNAFEGNNSLQFHHAESTGCWEMWISQDLDKSLLVREATYKLVLNYKGDFEGSESISLILRNSTIDLWLYTTIEFYAVGEWYELSYEFGLPDDIGNNDMNMNIHFCIQGVKSWWIDNVNLDRVE